VLLLVLLLGVLAYLTVDVVDAWARDFGAEVQFLVDGVPATAACNGETMTYGIVSFGQRTPQVTGLDTALKSCRRQFAGFQADRRRDSVIVIALWTVVALAVWRGRTPRSNPEPAP